MGQIIITIDGPAGAGKSTVAKKLAKCLNFSYLDTGAMYRALTLKALRAGIDLEVEELLIDIAHKTDIDLKEDELGNLRIFLDGQDVSEEIRSIEVTNNTFHIARAPRIREILVKWQRAIGQRHNIVAEGRDVGTVVFPQATNKFYLDADLSERSHRRYLELKVKGKTVVEQKLCKDLEERDHKDFSRKVGPLKKAEDAVFIDSTKLSIDEVIEEMVKVIKKNVCCE